MHKIKVLIFGLLVILLSQSGFAALPVKTTPCTPRWSLFSFFFGRPNIQNPFVANDTTQPRRYFDLTCLLPNSGTFNKGTCGWTVSSTGKGCVKSYTRFGQGWVGLQVSSSGDTACIGTFNGYSTSYLNLSGKQYICDELMLCVVLRTNGGFSGNLNAKITTPNTAQPLNINGGILADGYGSLNTNKRFIVVGFMLTPVFQDITRIKNLEITYSGTSAGTGTPSEVIIDQVYLTGVRVIP